MTTVDLRVPGDVQRTMFTDLTRDREWAGYLMCGVHQGSGHDLLLGRAWHPVPPKMQITGTRHGFSWHSDFDVEMLNLAQRDNLACAVFHYHGGARPSLGHTSDRQTANSLMPFLSREAPDRPHVFGVLGDHAATGLVFRDGAEVGSLSSFRVSTQCIDDWSTGSTLPRIRSDGERHDRLIRGFGPHAHERLRRTTVGLVGCGGGGSHVVQQLAYLGVGSLLLVDADIVETSNLNRLIGAHPARASRSLVARLLGRGRGDVGLPKVTVMQRMVNAIDETIDVTCIQEAFPTTSTVEALRRVDILVACLDKLSVRDDLNRLAKRYLIPLVDIGIEITPDPAKPGSIYAVPGRITKVLADGPCLRCQGVIDESKLERERGGRPRGYEGPARLPDPAVVTLNGIVASIAATEVLRLITSFEIERTPNCGWLYDGLTGAIEGVTKRYDASRICEVDRGAGDP